MRLGAQGCGLVSDAIPLGLFAGESRSFFLLRALSLCELAFPKLRIVGVCPLLLPVGPLALAQKGRGRVDAAPPAAEILQRAERPAYLVGVALRLLRRATVLIHEFYDVLGHGECFQPIPANKRYASRR